MQPSHILAAGGIVVRESEGASTVAVVHRARYEDREGRSGDWVLPKGKLEKGEGLAEGARREVLEETGCRARISGPAWFSEYDVDGVPKVTVFFEMSFEEEVASPQESEIRSVHWIPRARARPRSVPPRRVGELAPRDRPLQPPATPQRPSSHPSGSPSHRAGTAPLPNPPG